MNQPNIKNTYQNWGSAFAYSLNTSLVLAAVIAVAYSTLSIFQQDVFYEFIGVFIGSFLFWALITGAITLFCSIAIGVPTVLILKKLKIDTSINAALVGGFSVYLYMVYESQSLFEESFLIFVFYGFVCGYAFMYGIKRDEES